MSEQLLARLATLESELAQLRAQNRKPAAAEPDLAALKQEMIQDPVGFMSRRMNLSQQEMVHVNRVNFAHVMGDQAPQELKYLAQLGPQMAQQSALVTTVNDLRRLVDEQVIKPKQAESTRQSIQALLADKTKYPHFSTAIANNPTLLDSKLGGRSGSAEEIASQLEAEAAAFAAAFGVKPAAQPASDNADSKKEAQSTQSQSAPLAGTPVGDPPPIKPPSGGPMTPDEDRQIREALSRKFGLV